MNIFKQTKQFTSIIRTLLFCIGVLSSCSVFAVNPGLVEEVEQNTTDIATNVGNISANSTAIATNASNISTNSSDIADLQEALPVHFIGEQYAGGIIFYLDASGQHGLIAQDDQNTDVQWYNTIDRVTGATGDGLGAGKMNTTIIISTQISDNPSGNFAARVAANYKVQEDGETPCAGVEGERCYGDWYLPSKVELNLMWENLADSDGDGRNNGLEDTNNLGGFESDAYWSSLEIDDTKAIYQTMGSGHQVRGFKNGSFRVRAIRAF